VADGVESYHVDPGAPWLEEVGGDPDGTRFEAALAVRVDLTFDDRYAGVDHTEEWEAIYFPLAERFDPAAGIAVDHDPRDFRSEPPRDPTYVLAAVPIQTKAFFRDAEKAIANWLHRNRSVEVLRNLGLKLYSRVGESREDFDRRCLQAAQDAADAEVAKIRDRFESRIDRLRDQIETARLDVETAEMEAGARRQDEMMSGVGDLIGVLVGGRRSGRKLSGAARRRSQTRKAEQRIKKAELKHTQKVDDLEELEDDLAEEILEINAKWNDIATDVETVEIGLERSDVVLQQTALVWIGRG
jgi:hypothetical protein